MKEQWLVGLSLVPCTGSHSKLALLQELLPLHNLPPEW